MAKFYGIGVGPGDPELLTLKAAKILNTIDVLMLPDSQRRKENIAYEIALEHINPDAKLVSVEFPMVTDTDIINRAGKAAAEVVEQNVYAGRNVAFITLGDPSIYSTYSYIVKSLAADVEVETVPGITSFCAAAAVTNKPLVEGDEILSIIPATAPEKKIIKALEGSTGNVIMKVYNQKEKVLRLLKEYDLIGSSVLLQRVGFEDCTLEGNLLTGLSGEKQYLSIILSRKEK